MTVELAEEHSTSNLTSERFEAEQSERLRLGKSKLIFLHAAIVALKISNLLTKNVCLTEKELDEQQCKYRNLQEASEKLEMELICAKSDLNGYVINKCHLLIPL